MSMNNGQIIHYDNSKGRGLAEVPRDLPMLLTVNDAAALGGFCGKFVRDQLRKGAIQGCKVGGAWRVNRDAWLKQLGIA